MSCSAATAPGENCTEDVLFEILLRLPVKSLLRFKAVSKSWLSLISSPAFVKSQLLHATTSNAEDDKNLIVNLYKVIKGEAQDVSHALLHPNSGQLVADLKLPYSKNDYPDHVMPRTSVVVGSDMGVVCVFVWGAHYKVDIYLWNPATKQSKRIPKVPKHCFGKHVDVGFGFDPIDSDFKLVMFSVGRKYRNKGYCSTVHSANGDLWRDIKPITLDNPGKDGFEVCLHGFLCGVGKYGMVAFDLNKEVFICNVKLPVSSFDAYRARMTDFKDSIAFITSKNIVDKINLWTLDDETCLRGGELGASWTLMLSIAYIYVGWPIKFVIKGFFDDSNFKLVSKREYWFSYKNGVRNVVFRYKTLQKFEYTETLVSISRSKQVDQPADCWWKEICSWYSGIFCQIHPTPSKSSVCALIISFSLFCIVYYCIPF